MEKPSLAEAGLMEEPVQALHARLAQLLADWPEHPILSKLLALCDRLLGAPHCPPISAAACSSLLQPFLPGFFCCSATGGLLRKCTVDAKDAKAGAHLAVRRTHL